MREREGGERAQQSVLFVLAKEQTRTLFYQRKKRKKMKMNFYPSIDAFVFVDCVWKVEMKKKSTKKDRYKLYEKTKRRKGERKRKVAIPNGKTVVMSRATFLKNAVFSLRADTVLVFGYCGYCTTGSNFIRSNRATICFPNVNRRSVATYGCVLSINNRLCASLQ